MENMKNSSERQQKKHIQAGLSTPLQVQSVVLRESFQILAPTKLSFLKFMIILKTF